jgi:membrane protease YdiL (CAAX protease family)
MGKKKATAHVVAMMGLLALLALWQGTPAEAGNLPASLSSWLTGFQAGVVGLGVVMFVVGGAGWLGQKMDMIHSPVLAGTLPWIVHGGMFGGIVAIATGIGLTAAGGTLPI